MPLFSKFPNRIHRAGGEPHNRITSLRGDLAGMAGGHSGPRAAI